MRKKETDEIAVEVDALDSVKKYMHSEPGFGAPTYYLSTGNYALDYIISGKADGSGGWPGGRIVEIFGDPSSGKTLLIAKAASTIQQTGGIFVLADAEYRWDDEFAIVNGVDPTKIVKYQPDTIEEYIATTDEILEKLSGKVPRILFALDSLSRLSTLDEVEKMAKSEDQGKRAKKIHAMMRILPSRIKKANAILLVSNHIIRSPTPYTRPDTPGGKGIQIQATIRVETQNPKPIKLEGKERMIGNVLHCVCTKNSIQPPFGSCHIDLYWASGVSKFSGLLELMEDIGIVEKAGAWYKYGELKFQSCDFENFVEQHPDMLCDDKWENPYFKSKENK